ncbi:MAG: InlB B-repeat-containing protein, partial [Candidatus Izemoplasmatales bacterium]
VTANIAVNAVFSAVKNQYTVTFYDEDGTTELGTSTVDYGTAATAPVTPVKLATAEWTYTFTDWSAPITNVTANIAVNALFSAVKNQYTVTFYDEDGTTELGTSTVDYGTAATAPEEPAKTNYMFMGWNLDYSNVEADMDIIATFHLTVLYEFIYDMMYYEDEFGEYIPTNQEIANEICFIKSILDTESDEDTMAIITNGIGVMESFTIASKADFENWFESISLTYGFTRQMIIDTLLRYLVIQIDSEVDGFDITYFEERILYNESQILFYEEMLSDIDTAALEYCALLTTVENQEACAAVFNAEIAQIETNTIFNNMLNAYAENNENWDWYTWEQIRDYKNMALYAKYVDLNYTVQAEYENYLSDYMSGMDPDEYNMYMTKLNLYESMMNEYYCNGYSLQNALSGVFDNNDNNVLNSLMLDFCYPHQEYSNYIFMFENEITECERVMAELIANHEFMTNLQIYLSDPINLGKVKILFGSVYDAFEYVALNLDEPTFSMLTALADPDTINAIQGLFNGSISLEDTGVTMADLSDYIANLSSIMGLIGFTVDETDVNNFKDLAKDIIGVYVNSTDAPLLEKVAMITVLEAAVDHYTEGLGVVFYEIKDLLDTIDEVKLTIVFEQVEALIFGEMESLDYSMILNASILIDELLGDGAFDINAVVGYGIDLYFDITTQFMGDSTGAKTALQAMLTDIITAAGEISLYDFELLTAEQLETLNDFIGSAMWIQQFITIGPENYLDIEPVGYTHDQFVQTILSMFGYGEGMTEEKADAVIVMLVDALGYEDEKTTYFAIMSIFQLGDDITSIGSLTDIQDVYLKLNLLGFTKESLANIAAKIFIGYVSFQIDSGIFDVRLTEIDAEIADLQAQADSLLLQYNLEEDQITNFIAYIHSMILVMDDPIEAIALTAETMMYQDIDNYIVFDLLWNQIRNENGEWWSGDDDAIIQNLINYRDLYYLFNYGEFPDETNRDAAQNNYLVLWDSLSFEQQNVYQPIIEAWEGYLSYHYGTFLPQIDLLQAPELAPLGWQTRNGMLTDRAELLNKVLNHNWTNNQMYWINNQIMWLQEEQNQIIADQAQMLVIYNYLAEAGNEQLVVDVAVILMNEIDNLLINADPDFVNLIIDLMNGSVAIEDLTALEILDAAQGLSATLKLLFSTLDVEGTDADKIILLVQGINTAFINSRTDIDQTQKDDLILLWNEGIEDWVSDLSLSIDVLTNFLDELTEAKIETILVEIGIISSLDGVEPDMDNLVRAVAIANIFTTVLGDDSLDYDFIIATGIQLYFDGKYNFSYDGTIDINAKIIEIQTLIDDLVTQSDVIDGYDPQNLLAGELEEIDAFHILIEELIMFFGNGPEAE